MHLAGFSRVRDALGSIGCPQSRNTPEALPPAGISRAKSMTEREADEAELALLRFVLFCKALGISPTQIMAVAMVKIPAMYHGAYDPKSVH